MNLPPNTSSLTAEDSLHSHSRSTTDFWFTDGLLIYSRGGPIENTSVTQQWIYANHRKHLFLYCCSYSALHSNGSYPIVACVFVVRECVYLAVAQQRVCMSQYLKSLNNPQKSPTILYQQRNVEWRIWVILNGKCEYLEIRGTSFVSRYELGICLKFIQRR
jgi:hypothetical protein